MTRRTALELLGMSAAYTALVPGRAFAQAPAFTKGAIIRTLFKDYAPEDLAGGATLFHEHMSLAPDFMDKFRAASAAVRAMNADRPAPAPRLQGVGPVVPAARGRTAASSAWSRPDARRRVDGRRARDSQA
jgi:hypothetical protein